MGEALQAVARLACICASPRRPRPSPTRRLKYTHDGGEMAGMTGRAKIAAPKIATE
ncbi:MAG: hypothetical protein HQL41_10600 [Alphaproteobacteria bacterium]|nr:hypothetical protein [Alphaproteobacteria bacterium]